MIIILTSLGYTYMEQTNNEAAVLTLPLFNFAFTYCVFTFTFLCFHFLDNVTRFGYMEQTDGETAALTSPEDIKTQMKVAIANFQASEDPDLRPICEKYQPIHAKLIKT